MQARNSRSDAPIVSVILPVRNGGKELPPALDTILNQSFTDFEVIAIDDGSTDGTGVYLDGITDSRVRVWRRRLIAAFPWQAGGILHGKTMTTWPMRAGSQSR